MGGFPKWAPQINLYMSQANPMRHAMPRAGSAPKYSPSASTCPEHIPPVHKARCFIYGYITQPQLIRVRVKSGFPDFFEIWIFGSMENAPMHISTC